MRRFDRAIKVIQDEIYRVTGKVAHDAVDKKLNPMYSVRTNIVMNLKEALEILRDHERNKNV